MGKFLLCSNTNQFENLKQKLGSFFVESSSLKEKFGNLCVYNKLRVNSKNVYECNLGFVAGTGTYIYKCKKDKEALEEVWKDFDGNINLIRNNMIGSYCIIIYKNEQLFLFVDGANTYNVYYYLEESTNNLIATTTYYHIASVISDKSVDDMMFISEWLHSTILDFTMFNKIKKLTGNRMLTFKEGIWQIESVEYPNKCLEVELYKGVYELYSPLKECFNNTSIFLTGGQDSRLSLALLLSLKIKPKVYYGVGNSSDTCTKKDDLNIVYSIADKYELPVQLMDWNDSDYNNKADYLNKYGELFTVYCMNKNFMNEFEEKIDTDFICFGYFGEVFRIIESIESYDKEIFTLDEFIDDLYLSGIKKLFKDNYYKEYRSRIYTLFREVCSQKEIDPEHLTKKTFQKLNTIYRQRWDTLLNNFANMFFYSFPLFGDKNITDVAEEQSYESRINSKYQMQLIKKFEPSLLDIPFFSHIKTKSYNGETNELTDTHISSRMKDKIREIVKNPVIIYKLKIVYYLIRKDKKGLKEIKLEQSEKKSIKKELGEKKVMVSDIINVNYAIDSMDARRIKYLLLLEYMITELVENTEKF